MNSADGTIHFNLSFSQNSIYLRVRLRERFVNPQLLKQLAVYKIKEGVIVNENYKINPSNGLEFLEYFWILY